MNLKKIIKQGGKNIELLINQETRSKIDSFNQFYFNAISQGPSKEIKGLNKKGKNYMKSRNMVFDDKIQDNDEIEMFKGSYLF